MTPASGRHAGTVPGPLLDAYEDLFLRSDDFPYICTEQVAADPRRLRYARILVSTMLWRIQLEWVKMGMVETPAELADIALEQAPRSAWADGRVLAGR